MKRTSRSKPESLSAQVARKLSRPVDAPVDPSEGSDIVVSTGSTLLDLAISGGRFPAGGIPLGILVEIFGPSGTGKTVLLCQIAGNLQKMAGEIMFYDPEARLNKQFASMFGLSSDEIEYAVPDTIPQVFQSVREWVPGVAKSGRPCGVFADSLAALSTNLEMGKDEGDKMGMRRAKEFSEELRKTCRIITQQNVLMVCSNQVRQNLDAGPYGQRFKSPGGEAIGFHTSLRLRMTGATKLKEKRTIRGKEHTRVAGIKTTIEIHKSSLWKPHRSAEVYILYDYGIDDVRANLQFLKTTMGDSQYMLGDEKLGKSLNDAVQQIESEGLESILKDKVVCLWNEVESAFQETRRPRNG